MTTLSSHECLSPTETSQLLSDTINEKKFKTPLKKSLLGGILGGIYIGFGGMLSSFITQDTAIFFGIGITKIFAGLAFSLGLILIILTGAELFTGNTLMIMNVLEKKQSWKMMLKKWIIIYVANMVGAILLSLLYFFSDS